MNVKVSVIMGIYNCESTLSDAINSILVQTFSDWELIMCDDGSNDNTYSIAKLFADYYDNIHILQNPQNAGLNYTLNKCLECAHGEYIARMDGDDISLPTRFEEEVRFLDSHPEYSIVSTPMLYFDEKGGFGVGTGGIEPKSRDIPHGTPFPHAAAMVRKQAYEAVNGYSVADKYLRVEDWHLWTKMYAAGYKGYILEKPLYQMRDDRNATSRRKFKYRINEARVSAFAVKTLRLPICMYMCSLRSIAVGLLPKSIYHSLHKNKLEKNYISATNNSESENYNENITCCTNIRIRRR